MIIVTTDRIEGKKVKKTIDRMSDDAKRMGANAILEIRFTTSVLMGGAAELLAYGTAVIVEDE